MEDINYISLSLTPLPFFVGFVFGLLLITFKKKKKVSRSQKVKKTKREIKLLNDFS